MPQIDGLGMGYIEWSPDGRSLAVTGHSAGGALDAETGALIARCDEHAGFVYGVAWSPDGRVVATGDSDGVVLWDKVGGEPIFSFEHEVRSLAWSPSGQYLVAAGDEGNVACWEPMTESAVCTWKHAQSVLCARWASDSRRVACCSDDGEVVIWDGLTGGRLWSFEAEEAVHAVAWSPSERYLSYRQMDGSIWVVEIENARSPQLVAEPHLVDGTFYLWGGLVWSPEGSFLVSSQEERVVVVDVADFGESAPPAERRSSVPARLTSDLAALPGTLSALHRLRLPAPLSLVRDLRSLLSGGRIDTPAGSLATLPGMRQLISLRWRGGALAGLVALLLRETQFDDWTPPSDFHADELRRRLTEALRGDVIDPVDPEVSLTPIRQAAEAVDERLMTLLSTLGPEAVAADPGIVLRLLRHVPDLPKLAEPQRRLLSLRVAPLEPGPAQGSGIGVDRTGISPSGPLTALLPSQLAYPRDLFIWRYRNRELLYRARTGREPPRLRPAVLVLDVSPASFGPIEGMTRPAAFVLASTLRRSGVPTVLVAAGGQERVHLLEQPADLVRLFTLRSQERADPERVMSVAQGVRGSLRDGALEPVVVLLTQPWWGEGETSRSPAHVRGLFVQYPGRPVRPAWADVCERWETIDSRDHDRLPQALGRLIA